jgi:hypothetical protein
MRDSVGDISFPQASHEQHWRRMSNAPDSGGMSKQAERREAWRQRVSEQERSWLSIRAYCKQQGLGEHWFYSWRQRLRSEQPVGFALVEARPERREEPKMLELVLGEGERLRIPCNEAALRVVLQVLRSRP